MIQKNRKNLEYMSRAYRSGKLSHAYIIEGAGNESFADEISTAFMCEHPLTDAAGVISGCGRCPSCVKARTGNHPDIIHVRHEKPTVLSVGEIRDQVVGDISITPYYGSYKIYIIADADLMNESAQNALLKTIEEPEDYAVILLLSDNADILLQTIRSRCITVRMEKEEPQDIVAALMDESGERVFQILDDVGRMDALEINRAAKELETFDRQAVMKIVRLWSRDVLVYKSTSEFNRLFFLKKKDIIKKTADRISYEGINQIICSVEAAGDRLDSSVKGEAVFESLLLSVRHLTAVTDT